MSPEMRKAALYGMVTLAYNNSRHLVREYEEIRKLTQKIQRYGDLRDEIVRQTALEIVEELDRNQHLDKLKELADELAELQHRVDVTESLEELDDVFLALDAKLDDLSEHFCAAIPKLQAKFKDAMRRQTELN